MLKENNHIKKINNLTPEIDYPCLLRIRKNKLVLNNVYVLTIHYTDKIFHELKYDKTFEFEFYDYNNCYIPVNYIEAPYYLTIIDKLAENERIILVVSNHIYYPVIITRAYVKNDMNKLRKLIENYLLSVLTPNVKDFKQIEQSVKMLNIDLDQEIVKAPNIELSYALDIYKINRVCETYENFIQHYIYPAAIKLRNRIINDLKDKNYDYILLLYHEE